MLRTETHYAAGARTAPALTERSFTCRVHKRRCTIICLSTPEVPKAQSTGQRTAARQPARPVRPFTLDYGQLVYQKAQGSKALEADLVGLSPLDAQKLLTAKVKAARTIEQFQDLLQAGGTLVDSTCLVALLIQLPKVSRAQKLTETEQAHLGAVTSQLLQLVKLRIKEFDTPGLVSVTVGLAKLGHTDATTYKLLMQQSQPKLDQLTPQSLSSFIWAVATAGVQPSGSWLTDFYRSVEAQAEVFNSQDLANLFWGLCKFDLMPDLWLVDQLVAACLVQLQLIAGKPSLGQDAATIITCLARYYHTYNQRVPDEWIHSFTAIVQPHLRQFMPMDLVSMVHSMVCLNYMPNRLWMTDYYAVLKDRLIFDPALSYMDFSRLLWALSRINYTPTQSWQREFVEVSIPKLSYLRPRALCELIWALACWDCKPSTKWLKVYFRVTASKLADYQPQQLAITMSALAKVNCRAPSQWVQPVLSKFCSQIAEVKSHDLVTMLESTTAVCEDKLWLSQQCNTLQLIADTAASKFHCYDGIMHAKLVLALARANCFPGTAWLVQQQASLAQCWSDDIDTTTAQDLKLAYQSWDVELDQSLAAELDAA